MALQQQEPGPLDGHCSLVYLAAKGRYCILAKSALRRHVQIIRIDPVTGALKFTQSYGRDMFPTMAQALDHLKCEGPHQILGSGTHMLGYVVLGHTGLLLMVAKARVSATLPGGHQVRGVTTSRWHRIPLQVTMPPGVASQSPTADPEAQLSQAAKDEFYRGLEKITTFPIDGAHFFCETLDVTRPFPSHRPATQPSWEFVWNRWLTAAFRSVGLDYLCPALLQGMCEEKTILDLDGQPFYLALISRRSRLHVGPRYKARGLNINAEPGNEAEVEQVIWKPGKAGVFSWSRYVWRRGSVPLWWGVQLKQNGLGEAEIRIEKHRTFKGSRRYVRRLQRRYCPVPHLELEQPVPAPTSMHPEASGSGAAGATSSLGQCDPGVAGAAAAGAMTRVPASASDPSLSVPLMFLSLLRKGTPDKDRSEAKLASAFDFVANALKKEHNLPLTYLSLDWHEMDKQLGTHGIVEAFWSVVSGIIPTHGFALGQMAKVGQDHSDYGKAGLEPPAVTGSGMLSERCTSSAGLGWQARWFAQQRGVARYNCADSLDRTNVGSFFGAVQVLVEQCRSIDIAIAIAPKGADSMARMKRQQMASNANLTTLTRANRPLGTLSIRGSSNGAAPGQQVGAAAVAASAARIGSKVMQLVDPRNPRAGALPGQSSTVTHSPSTLGTHAASMPDFLGLDTPPVLGMPETSLSRGSPQTAASEVDEADLASSAALLSSVDVRRPPSPAQPLQQTQVAGLGELNWLDAVMLTLPSGWEVKMDKATGKYFYVDHNNRQTHWRHPLLPEGSGEGALRELVVNSVQQRQVVAAAAALRASPGVTGSAMKPSLARMTTDSVLDLSEKSARVSEEDHMLEPLVPWGMFKSGTTVKQFGRRICLDALSAMAELFLVNGDLIAWLYTGSQAMHSERILVFEPENSKLRKVGVGHVGNIMVGIKRRFNNVMVDSDRQQQIEMFLGLKLSVYFPQTKLYYRDDGPLPLDYPETDDDQDPTGYIDWSPDKAGFGPSGTPMGEMGAGHAGVKGSHHIRKQSFSTVDLFAANREQGLRALSQFVASPGSAALAAPSGVSSAAVLASHPHLESSVHSQQSMGHMHKVASCTAVSLLGQEVDMDKPSVPLGPTHQHSHSAGDICHVAHCVNTGDLLGLEPEVGSMEQAQLACAGGRMSLVSSPTNDLDRATHSAQCLTVTDSRHDPFAPPASVRGQQPVGLLKMSPSQVSMGSSAPGSPMVSHPLRSENSWGAISARSEGYPSCAQGAPQARPASPVELPYPGPQGAGVVQTHSSTYGSGSNPQQPMQELLPGLGPQLPSYPSSMASASSSGNTPDKDRSGSRLLVGATAWAGNLKVHFGGLGSKMGTSLGLM